MATTVPKCLFVLFMFLSYVLIIVQARPLNIIGTGSSATGGDIDFFDWLSLGAIKKSGPNPGKGHQFPNTENLGGIKGSGPSGGGVGHKFTNTETLGGIKDSGPSGGGAGH